MMTEALITELARDVQPVSPRAVGWRLMAGIGGGGVLTLGLIAGLIGFRGDLAVAVHGFSFWMKWAYTIAWGIGAIVLLARLARPQPVRLWAFWPLPIPFAVLAALSLGEMTHAPRGDWAAMWLGSSWKVCPWLIAICSLPIFAGVLWSFGRFAPTQLRAAGAAAGLASGAWAATLYGLHCSEVSALFVVCWYTLGMALATGLGALIGPRLLRW